MASLARLPHRLPILALALAAWAVGPAQALQEPPHSAELDAAIIRAAKRHGVPESLVRRIIMRESKYVANARNRAYWGLMQISVPTARSMGFHGSPQELLNPFVNLQYAVPYLANAFVAAGRREDAAVRLYAAGYYYNAKAHGVLGMLRTADSAPLNGVPPEPALAPAPAAVASADSAWSLFGSSAPQPQIAQQQMAYAASPQGVAVAPGQAQIQAIAPAAPVPAEKTTTRTSDKNAGTDVDMVAARDGTMAPPKRWQRDGGTTVIARGEQAPEATAALRLGGAEPVAESRQAGRHAGRHAHKSAVFAQLEPLPPAPAQ